MWFRWVSIGLDLPVLPSIQKCIFVVGVHMLINGVKATNWLLEVPCSAAAQALINVDQLKRIHFFAVIIDLPILRSIITAILPGARACSGTFFLNRHLWRPPCGLWLPHHDDPPCMLL